MKKIILITMLMSAVFAQSDCNESNWKEYYKSDGKDMSDCNLTGANLTNAFLRGANLTDADLRGADLSGAILYIADLSGADLTGANLYIADLRGANLTDADLTNARLGGTKLEGAELNGTDLSGVALSRAKLEGANLDGVISRDISYKPLSLPDGWSLVDGTLINDEWGSSNPPDDMMTDGDNPDDMMAEDDNPDDMMADRELSDELHSKIRGNKRRINLYQWNAWEKENDPQVSKGETTFRTIDKNNDGKIGTGEFFKFYQRWIQD